GERESFARSQRLLQSISGINAARRRANQVKGPVKLKVTDRLPYIANMNLRDRLTRLVLQSHVHASLERSALGINIDRRVDRRNLGLKQIFVLLELALVIGLDVAPRLGIEIFIEHVGIVEVPPTSASRDDSKQQ